MFFYRSLIRIDPLIRSGSRGMAQQQKTEESVLYYIGKLHDDSILLHWFCRTSRSAHGYQDSSSKCNNKETTLTDMFVYFFLTVNDHKENHTNFYLSQPVSYTTNGYTILILSTRSTTTTTTTSLTTTISTITTSPPHHHHHNNNNYLERCFSTGNNTSNTSINSENKNDKKEKGYGINTCQQTKKNVSLWNW